VIDTHRLGLSDPRWLYEFELSVRKSTGNDTGLFLSYLGAKQRLWGVYDEDKQFAFVSVSSCNFTSVGRPSATFLPVLSDVQVSDTLSNTTNDTFAISQPGSGLIELSRYGVSPFPNGGMSRVVSVTRCVLVFRVLD
jgi:hypothetical protein